MTAGISSWIVRAAVAAALLALAVPAVRHLREQPPPPPPPVYLSLEPPPGARLGAGDEALDAAISPDGREIVFVATMDGAVQLWRRALAGGRAEPLPGTDGASFPAWKQSGGAIAFFAGGKLRQIVLADGTVHDLAEAPAPGGATWMPDGSLLFASGDGPVRRMLEGRVTAATTLAPGDRAHRFPMAAGDSGAFTYVAVLESGRSVLRLVTSDGERDLVSVSGHGQIVNSVLLYPRDGVLFAQPLDAATWEPAGRATPIVSAVGVAPSGHTMFTASARLLIAAEATPHPREIAWLDPRTGARTRIADPGDFWQLRLSPDDRQAAVTVVAPLLRTLDVIVVPTSGAAGPQQLTRALAADTDPVWSPDGSRVLFRSLQSGRPQLFTRAPGAGDTPDEPLAAAEPGDRATDWAADAVLVQSDGGATGLDIWRLNLGTGRREPIVTDAFDQSDARWSPDRSWIAFVSDESGRPDIYALRPGPDAQRIRVSFAGGSRPRWSRDGRSIYFVRDAWIMRADVAPGTSRFSPAEPVAEVPGLRDFDTAHRSDRLAVLVPAGPGGGTSAIAVLDWSGR